MESRTSPDWYCLHYLPVTTMTVMASLVARGMESVVIHSCISGDRPTRIFDGNHDLTFEVKRLNRQLSSTVFQRPARRIQHQVHEHLYFCQF